MCALLIDIISSDLEQPQPLILISHDIERRAVSLQQLNLLFYAEHLCCSSVLNLTAHDYLKVLDHVSAIN